MAGYIVSPPETPDWRMDAETFAARLRSRWPQAQIREGHLEHDPAVLDFAIENNGERVDGALYDSGISISLDGDLKSVMDTALWFAQQVPPDPPLWFYDDAFNAHIDLSKVSDAQEAVTAFLSEANR